VHLKLPLLYDQPSIWLQIEPRHAGRGEDEVAVPCGGGADPARREKEENATRDLSRPSQGGHCIGSAGSRTGSSPHR
jgi:hypothetical protein